MNKGQTRINATHHKQALKACEDCKIEHRRTSIVKGRIVCWACSRKYVHVLGKGCPDWLKEAYKRAVDYKCEQCHKEGELHIHRMIRGNEGGTYAPYNIKVLCKECHNKMHYKEFQC